MESKLNKNWFLENSVDENFECSICADVLTDPHQCPNGHMFCKVCIDSCLGRQSHCPTCKIPTNSENLSKCLFVKNIISNLTVRCASFNKYNEENCSWTGPCHSRDGHNSECQFRLVKCRIEGCSKEVKLKDVNQHEKECVQRVEECEYCSTSYDFVTLRNHKVCCEMRPLTCEQCGDTVRKQDLLSHTQQTCPFTLVPCPLKACQCCSTECTGAVRRDALQRHLAEHNCRDQEDLVFKLVRRVQQLESECASLRADSQKHLLSQLSNQQAVSSPGTSSSAVREIPALRPVDSPGRLQHLNHVADNRLTANGESKASDVRTEAAPVPPGLPQQRQQQQQQQSQQQGHCRKVKFCFSFGNYEGEMSGHVAEGYGVMHYTAGPDRDAVYEGQFKGNMRHGQGVMKWENGVQYEGEWEYGRKCGEGRLDLCNGGYYEGGWRDNKKWGEGLLVYSDGGRFKGTFKNNMKHGWGEKTREDGSVSTGQWRNDLRIYGML